jgi:hypothetical protein
MFIFIILKGIRAIIYKIDVNSPSFWYFGYAAQLTGLVAVVLGGFGLYVITRVATLNIINSLIAGVLAVLASALYWYFTPIKKLRSRKDVDNYSKKLYHRNLLSKEWITSGDWIQILVGLIVISFILYIMFSK